MIIILIHYILYFYIIFLKYLLNKILFYTANGIFEFVESKKFLWGVDSEKCGTVWRDGFPCYGCLRANAKDFSTNLLKGSSRDFRNLWTSLKRRKNAFLHLLSYNFTSPRLFSRFLWIFSFKMDNRLHELRHYLANYTPRIDAYYLPRTDAHQVFSFLLLNKFIKSGRSAVPLYHSYLSFVM